MHRFTGDVPKLGYHDQYVVDGGKARIIHRSILSECIERVKGYYATEAY
jgi:hypothetical protein